MPDCIADYTVQVYEKTTYLRLSRDLYISAVRNSLIERKTDFENAQKDDSQRFDSLNRIVDSLKLVQWFVIFLELSFFYIFILDKLFATLNKLNFLHDAIFSR